MWQHQNKGNRKVERKVDCFYSLMLLLGAFLGICNAANAAIEPKKLALLLGNAGYTTLPRLHDAENNARLLDSSLRDIGFETREAFNLLLPAKLVLVADADPTRQAPTNRDRPRQRNAAPAVELEMIPLGIPDVGSRDNAGRPPEQPGERRLPRQTDLPRTPVSTIH